MSCGALRTSLTSGPKGQKVNCLGIQWVLFSPKRLTRIGQSSNVFLKQALSLTQILIHFTAHPLTQLNKQSFTVQISSTVAAGYVLVVVYSCRHPALCTQALSTIPQVCPRHWLGAQALDSAFHHAQAGDKGQRTIFCTTAARTSSLQSYHSPHTIWACTASCGQS